MTNYQKEIDLDEAYSKQLGIDFTFQFSSQQVMKLLGVGRVGLSKAKKQGLVSARQGSRDVFLAQDIFEYQRSRRDKKVFEVDQKQADIDILAEITAPGRKS